MTLTPNPSARNLVLAFFHAAADRSLEVATLVTATGMLGLTGNATRVALTRLLQERWLERDERGRYRLRAERAAAASGLVPYVRISAAVRRWAGRFFGCTYDARELPDALRRLGFRSVAAGLAVRPDNLVVGTELLASRLGPGRLFVISPSEATAAWQSRWECDALSAAYRRMRERLKRSTARLRGLSGEKALAENWAVAQSSIFELEQDPLLPEEWVDAAARAALVRELEAYDLEARALWMKTIPGLELEGSASQSSPWTPRTEHDARAP